MCTHALTDRNSPVSQRVVRGHLSLHIVAFFLSLFLACAIFRFAIFVTNFTEVSQR